MSRPRNPFGSVHPGRLPATMVKVLAAEMSDPSRLRRGKQYAKDGSVLDIVIEPGTVTCEIQGSRPTPYIASIDVTRGDGMPLRRDITCACTCPDDENWDDHACKHVVAALFAFSNELLLEPELLDVWRGRQPGEDRPDDDGDDARDASGDATGEVAAGGPHDRRASRRHLSLVRDEAAAPAPRRTEDPLRVALRLQPGTTLPEIPQLEPAELPLPRDRDLAAGLRDALRHVRVDWD